MPIWSLTKERVEKLLHQIGDKEIEIDTLIKLSKEDLWNRDLDEFINEWRFQLEDEDKRHKKIASLGRRESRKLKIGAGKGAGGRKRKAQSDDTDDSDFGGPTKKPAAGKPAVTKHTQPRQGLLSHLSPLAKANQPKPKVLKAPKATIEVKKEAQKAIEVAQPFKKASDDIWMNVDGPSDLGSDPPIAPIFQKAKAATATTKKSAPRNILKSEDESDEEILKPTAASRKPRAAATKPVKYNILSDSDDSNGDDLLFDVGKMVKGIGNASADQSSNSRPLFSTSMSRPGSSAGLPKKSSSSKQAMDFDEDDTDYSKLVPAKKGATVTANAMVFSDDDDVDMDDDDFDAVAAAPPKKPAAKPKELPKAKAKPAPKAAPKPAPAPPKKLPLSPAAKAYAAKQARNKKTVLDDDDEDDDEIEKVANELLDDGDDSEDDDEAAPAVAARPSRRAAAAAGARKAWVLDDESEEEEGEGDTRDFETEDSD
jgi:DNA topoisomerase-2